MPDDVGARAGSSAGARLLARARAEVPVWIAVADSGLLAVACLVSYWLTASVLSRIHSLSAADDVLGGMWATIATIFVLRQSYDQSIAAALTRMLATFVSFAICLLYLVFLPFHAVAMAALIGLTSLILVLMGRPADAVTGAITTAIVMVMAAVSPQDAWLLPILRLADTLVGIAIGVSAAWIGLRLVRRLHPKKRDEAR
jgi:Fusaric acid resistance protein-like